MAVHQVKDVAPAARPDFQRVEQRSVLLGEIDFRLAMLGEGRCKEIRDHEHVGIHEILFIQSLACAVKCGADVRAPVKGVGEETDDSFQFPGRGGIGNADCLVVHREGDEVQGAFLLRRNLNQREGYRLRNFLRGTLP